jgi:hypothetical protein
MQNVLLADTADAWSHMLALAAHYQLVELADQQS